VKRLWGLLLAALIGLLVTAPSAVACSCVEFPGEKETLQGYEAAATARLIDIKNKDPQSDRATLVYRILRVYKNKNLDEGEELVLRNQGDGGACGLPRNKKKRYGLRLYRDRDGRLNSGLCSVLGPRELRRAAERSGNARAADGGGCGAEA